MVPKVLFESLYISNPSLANQQREMKVLRNLEKVNRNG